jgi:hypothetical protein
MILSVSLLNLRSRWQLKRGAEAGELPQYMYHIKRPVEEPEKPKPWQKPDYTAGFGLPPSAVKAMCSGPELAQR